MRIKINLNIANSLYQPTFVCFEHEPRQELFIVKAPSGFSTLYFLDENTNTEKLSHLKSATSDLNMEIKIFLF